MAVDCSCPVLSMSRDISFSSYLILLTLFPQSLSTHLPSPGIEFEVAHHCTLASCELNKTFNPVHKGILGYTKISHREWVQDIYISLENISASISIIHTLYRKGSSDAYNTM